jgi:hypothetical protein
MKVKTLRAHQNQFGTKFSKAEGEEYEHPSPVADIKFGYVEPVAAATTKGHSHVDGATTGGDSKTNGSAKKK